MTGVQTCALPIYSVVNSLRWGPDGWLYAAQGSTVTANVRVVASRDRRREKNVANPVYSQGQCIWRYHPEKHIYEVFAEGGGNAFGVELDPQGRIFSGHNGGDTRGFHYMQGAYLRRPSWTWCVASWPATIRPTRCAAPGCR